MQEKELWKNEFLAIFKRNINRIGSDEILKWLETSDFFEAPASAKYHMAIPGGLCRHSINVYKRLKGLLDYAYGESCPFNEETIAIVSLLHDVCKIDCYDLGWKNQKTYDSEKVEAADRWQIKHDAAGDFIWESVPQYVFNERFVFGHGEKSVYLIRNLMDLSNEEAVAIRFHMGAWQDGEKQDAGKAFAWKPLAFWLHMADSAATCIDEVDE